jgi:lysophospholipase L1-like esterase
VRRLAVLFTVAGLLLALAVPGSATASSRPIEYLALGDSLAFGYSPYQNPADPTAFVAYPEMAAKMLRDRVANASCPGETSDHFIDLGGPDHGCGAWRFGLGAPLHVAYSTSQLDYVDAFLASHPKTRLITIDMGINDVGALRDHCMQQADPIPCIQGGLPGVLANLSANMDTIYHHIRVDAGYRHKLVALTVYSPNYADQLTTGAVAAVNQVVAERTLAWNGIVADGFAAFAGATAAYGGSACAAGLLIPLASGSGCDDHPSAAGHKLLAKTIVRALRAD